jgi:hypothetical protein
MELQVVERTNAERAKINLPPLKFQADLHAAARWLAEDMAQKDYFDHTDRQGRSIDKRLPDYGYTDYRAIAENIAAGMRTPEAAVKGWLKSPGHRANMLSKHYREIGVGYAFDSKSKYQRYWVQDFGTRHEVFPVVIEREATRVTKPQVRLYVYGEGWAEAMRLSHDGKTWTAWQPYQAECDWTLQEGKGVRTVYVELRRQREIRRAQDDVELMPAPESKEKPD